MAFYIVARIFILLGFYIIGVYTFGVLIWRFNDTLSTQLLENEIYKEKQLLKIELREIEGRPRPCAGSNFALPPSSWENGPNGQICSQPSNIKKKNAVRH